MTNNYAVIVGGGSGTRMGSDMPKQFLLLNGLPVLMHTLKAFAKSAAKPELVLVLNPSLITHWNNLCREYAFTLPHCIVAGGPTRFHSVLNGLNHIKDLLPLGRLGYIAVHDGVRPLISQEIIDEGFVKITQYGGALVVATPSKDSVRVKSQDDVTKAMDRTTVFLVQTPQFFSTEILFEAYKQPYEERFTDDASVVENAGYPVGIIQGDTRNIKITFPEDLLLAEIMMKS